MFYIITCRFERKQTGSWPTHPTSSPALRHQDGHWQPGPSHDQGSRCPDWPRRCSSSFGKACDIVGKPTILEDHSISCLSFSIWLPTMWVTPKSSIIYRWIFHDKPSGNWGMETPFVHPLVGLVLLAMRFPQVQWLVMPSVAFAASTRGYLLDMTIGSQIWQPAIFQYFPKLVLRDADVPQAPPRQQKKCRGLA